MLLTNTPDGSLLVHPTNDLGIFPERVLGARALRDHETSDDCPSCMDICDRNNDWPFYGWVPSIATTMSLLYAYLCVMIEATDCPTCMYVCAACDLNNDIVPSMRTVPVIFLDAVPMTS